jgi:hypothetical protein
VAAPPGARHELVAADPARFFAGRDWVGMRLDLEPAGPDWTEVRDILSDGYRQLAEDAACQAGQGFLSYRAPAASRTAGITTSAKACTVPVTSAAVRSPKENIASK